MSSFSLTYPATITLSSVAHTLVSLLGEGSFATVHLAHPSHLPPTSSSNLVALKHVDLESTSSELEEIQSEISVLARISHPNLVHHNATYVTGTSLWISMEYLSGGSIASLLLPPKPLPPNLLSPSSCASLLRPLLSALAYLHSSSLLHRDIKGGNILVDGRGTVKLADFGHAVQLTHSVQKRGTFVGTPFWMAPEVITQSLYDSKADVWSLGITALELLRTVPPHSGVHAVRALFLIPKHPAPRLVDGEGTPAMADFVERCLQKDPAERATASELCEHPFVRGAAAVDERVVELVREKGLRVAREAKEAREAGESGSEEGGGKGGGGGQGNTLRHSNSRQSERTSREGGKGEGRELDRDRGRLENVAWDIDDDDDDDGDSGKAQQQRPHPPSPAGTTKKEPERRSRACVETLLPAIASMKEKITRCEGGNGRESASRLATISGAVLKLRSAIEELDEATEGGSSEALVERIVEQILMAGEGEGGGGEVEEEGEEEVLRR